MMVSFVLAAGELLVFQGLNYSKQAQLLAALLLKTQHFDLPLLLYLHYSNGLELLVDTTLKTMVLFVVAVSVAVAAAPAGIPLVVLMDCSTPKQLLTLLQKTANFDLPLLLNYPDDLARLADIALRMMVCVADLV